MTAAEPSFTVVSVIVGDGTLVSVIYLGVEAGNIMYGVLGRNIALALLIWRTRLCFIVALAWSRSVWMVVMYVGMLGLV